LAQCKECSDKKGFCNVHLEIGNGVLTTNNIPIGDGRGYETLEITGSCCTKIGYEYPAFKQEKCIVIYLDGLEVKADSATKFYRADTSMYIPPKYEGIMDQWGVSTITLEARMPTVAPNWYIQKVVRKNKKEIKLSDIIQYK